MRLTRKSLLLLAVAVLVAGVAIWYSFLRPKSAVATPGTTPGVEGTDPVTGLPATPGSTTTPDEVTFTPGPEGDTDNPVRITVRNPSGNTSGQLRVGSASDPNVLYLVLRDNQLVNRRGQLQNWATPQPSAGMVFKYLVDNHQPWLDSLDGLWFGIMTPHTIEYWEVDPGQPSYTWRRDGVRKGQTVFTLQTAPPSNEY